MRDEHRNGSAGPGASGAGQTAGVLGGGEADPLRDTLNLAESFRAHYAAFVEGFRSARQADRSARTKLVVNLIDFLQEAVDMSGDQLPLLRSAVIDAARGSKREHSQSGRKRT